MKLNVYFFHSVTCLYLYRVSKNQPNKQTNKKHAIIEWELFFKNKKNLEQIMSISK